MKLPAHCLPPACHPLVPSSPYTAVSMYGEGIARGILGVPEMPVYKNCLSPQPIHGRKVVALVGVGGGMAMQPVCRTPATHHARRPTGTRHSRYRQANIHVCGEVRLWVMVVGSIQRRVGSSRGQAKKVQGREK